MSDKNIDKDIEILKDMKGFFSDCEVCTDDCDEKTCVYLRAIENVLSELEELKKYDIRKIELKNGEIEKAPSFTKEQLKYMNLGIALYETIEKSELETWKKIAEKLADKLEFHYDYDYICFIKGDYGQCREKKENSKTCKECLLDWARKEVANDKQS